MRIRALLNAAASLHTCAIEFPHKAYNTQHNAPAHPLQEGSAEPAEAPSGVAAKSGALRTAPASNNRSAHDAKGTAAHRRRRIATLGGPRQTKYEPAPAVCRRDPGAATGPNHDPSASPRGAASRPIQQVDQTRDPTQSLTHVRPTSPSKARNIT